VSGFIRTSDLDLNHGRPAQMVEIPAPTKKAIPGELGTLWGSAVARWSSGASMIANQIPQAR